jgi:hypothetical protein
MPTTTYKPLATVTLASTAASVVLGNIPNTYRDLILVSSVASNDSFRQYRLRVNGDTGGNYYQLDASSNGSSASSNSGTAVELTFFNNGNPGVFAAMTTQFMDYSATDKHKPYIHRSSAPDQTIQMAGGRWANTTPITAIQIFTPVGTFVVGSTFSLYGIVA